MAKVLPCHNLESFQARRPGIHELINLMRTKNSDYYAKHGEKLFPDQKQRITYSFNEKEQTIVGIMEEKENLIFLYEYRGKYVGIEFFISFSKESISYKLIKVDQISA
jgi:hypothetical protein